MSTRAGLDDVCTCGHLQDEHKIMPAPASDGTLAMHGFCAVLTCPCNRYDQRRFTEPELDQRRREQFEELKRKRAAETAAAAPPASAVLERIAIALERIAGELEVLAGPVRRANPCPKGGRHQFTHEPLPNGGAKMDCARCGAKWAETEVF